MAQSLKSMQSVMQFKAVHIRKIVVQDKEVRRLRSNCLKCLAAGYVMPGFVRRFLVDELSNKLANRLIVIDDNDHLLYRLSSTLYIVSSVTGSPGKAVEGTTGD